MAALISISAMTAAQAQTAARGALFNSMPGVVFQQVDALGSRVRSPGKERTVLTGVYVDAAGNHPARVTYQVPGLVILEGLGNNESRVSFDGERKYGRGNARDDVFLETFIVDTAEGMLVAARQGSAVRALGRGFGPNSKTAPNYTGPRYDIFEVAAPVPTPQGRALTRLKRYYFDTKTGWLLSTRYEDRTAVPTVKVETRFSQWTVVDGSAYPGRIERYEEGKPIFSFVVTSVSAHSRAEAASFR
jgi:hypothetical protein